MNNNKVIKISLIIVKNILSLFLILSIFSFLFCYTMLASTEKIFYKENIKNIINNININEIIGEDIKNELYSTLEEMSIPSQYIDKMLEDKQIREEISNYVITSIDYISNKNENELPKLEPNKITEILIESFDRTLKEANEHNININNYISEEQIEVVHAKIKEYTPMVLEKVPQIQTYIENNEEYQNYQQELEKLRNIFTLIKNIFSYKILLIIISVVFSIIILLIKLKEKTFFKWMAMPILLVGIFTLMLNKIVPLMIENTILIEYSEFISIINPIVNIFLSTIEIHSIIYLIIFALLTIAQIILSNYIKRKIVSE